MTESLQKMNTNREKKIVETGKYINIFIEAIFDGTIETKTAFSHPLRSFTYKKSYSGPSILPWGSSKASLANQGAYTFGYYSTGLLVPKHERTKTKNCFG